MYWSGWGTVSWLLGLQIAMFVVYLLCKRAVPTHRLSLRQQVYSSLWLIAFYLLIMLTSYLGAFGGIGAIAHPWDTALVALIAVGIYWWGACTGIPSAQMDLGGDDDD